MYVSWWFQLLMTAYSTLKVDQNLAGTSTGQLEHEATAFWDPNDKGEEAAAAQQTCGQAIPIKALIRSVETLTFKFPMEKCQLHISYS